VHIQFFLLRMACTITSKNTDLSCGDALYTANMLLTLTFSISAYLNVLFTNLNKLAILDCVFFLYINLEEKG
jgi:hypothetical protein